MGLGPGFTTFDHCHHGNQEHQLVWAWQIRHQTVFLHLLWVTLPWVSQLCSVVPHPETKWWQSFPMSNSHPPCFLLLRGPSPPHTVAAGSRSPGPGPPRWPPGLTCGRRRSPRPGKVGSGFELRGPPGIITSNSSLFSPMAWRWGRGTSQWSSSLPIARPSALPWRSVPVYSPSENKPLEPWRRTQHFSPHVRPFPSHPALLLTLPCTRKPADRRTLVQPP